MVYRDDGTCHICGAETRASCSSCGEPVCEVHTLAGWVAEDPDQRGEVARRLARRLGGDGVCRVCVEREVALSVGEFVTVHRCGDPVLSQMLVEALRDEGLDARALGTQNAALLGAGQHIFEQRIEVPLSQAERATTTIATLSESSQDFEINDEIVGISDEDSAEIEDEEPDLPTSANDPRKRGLALGLALVFPGGSHLYARRPYTAGLLTLTFIVSVALLTHGALGPGLVLLLGVPAMDIVGGQLAVSAHNRGETVGPLFQLIHGLVLAALLALVAAIYA